MKISILIALLLVSYVSSTVFEKYYQEAYTIAASMNLQQKIGQTIQVSFDALTGKNGTTSADAIKYALGSVLVGGNGCPDENGNMIALDLLKEDQVKVLYANATL